MAGNSTSFVMMLCGCNPALSRSRHAMPIGLKGEVGSIVSFMLPIFLVANGVSVPISRGRPPGLFVQA